MGRYDYNKKEEADTLPRIEIWWLKKRGYLNGYKSGTISWSHGESVKSSISIVGEVINESDPHIKLNYTYTNPQISKKTDFDYKIQITTTPCNYGGKRYWFICPLVIQGKACGRRVGVIYLGGKHFGCRHCYDLSYSSKNENVRSKYHPLFGYLTLDTKMEKLEEQIKRRYYRGKPTKKQRKLQKLQEQQVGYYFEGKTNNLYNNDIHPPQSL